MQVSVIGATGSIGLSAASVLESHPERFSVDGLAARSDWRQMHRLCLRLRPKRAALEDAEAGQKLRGALTASGCETTVDCGPGAAERLAADGAETLIAAVTGVAGLAALRKALGRGARVLLASKEALVVGGTLLLEEAEAGGGQIFPLDSEHNAALQCIGGPFRPGHRPAGVASITLTASGGAFLHSSADELEAATPEQAVRHPNWNMGAKISVDSATLMNKGLELIEAAVLFGLDAEQLQVLIHPQSLVHALVTFADGSTLAQLAQPDMRVPIANGLAWPERIETEVPPLDLARAPDLQFAEPDLERFPCLALALEVLRAGGTAAVVLNAANEEAVGAFLAGRIRFTEIARWVDSALQAVPAVACDNFAELLELDRRVRDFCTAGTAVPRERLA